jgi:DNA-binding SARP family transcriptional activator/Tfp pilus assembly protein PilF
MAKLTVHLFGAPRIERDDSPVVVDTRKAIALLAYLVVTGKSHHRDTLATLLWPESNQERARAALRRTLSTLKNAIGERWLEVNREILGVPDISGLWVDVQEFRARLSNCHSSTLRDVDADLSCLPTLEEAVSLYRADFMAGFTLRDSASFDDWQFLESEMLRRELGGALERLVQGFSIQGDFLKALDYAQRWLSLDALYEPAHRHLMQLYTWIGRRDMALRQYRELVRILEEELRVQPLEETIQVYEAIRENRLAQPQKNTSSRPDTLPARVRQLGGADSYPFVGRADELDKLRQDYDSLQADGRFVLIEGEAGIGKSRLANEMIAHASARGGIIIEARCYPGEMHISYGPLVEGLRRIMSQPQVSVRVKEFPPALLAETARLLPEINNLVPALPAVPPLEGPGVQSRFFESLAQFLGMLLRGAAPGILFFDDLQWSDAATLDLIAFLVRRLQDRSFVIMGTCRSEDIDARHRLRHIMREAVRQDSITHIELDRLTSTEVFELVGSVSLGQPAEQLSDRLFQETEGLPFFLVEYLVALENSDESLNHSEWPIPGGIHALLNSRLADIRETGQQLLSTAAVIGRSFDFDTLREASGRGEEETVAALEELVERGLIREIESRSDFSVLVYDFSHEKLRNLVYDETSLARRRLLHRRVAESLKNRLRKRREVELWTGQIAQHFRLAGEEEEAARYYKLAGEQARSVYANEDALHHFQNALALGHPDTPALYEAIGDLQTLMGDYVEAVNSYEKAAAFSRAGDLANLEYKLGLVYHRRGDWEVAESHHRNALEDLESGGEGHLGSSIYAAWSLTAHRRGDDARARDLAEKALHLADQSGDLHALAQAHNILGILERGQSDMQAARENLEKSLALEENLNDPGLRVAALNNLALVASQEGEIERAVNLLEAAIKLCISQGDRHREAALHSNLADLFHAQGDSSRSMSHLKQSVEIYAEIGEQAGSWEPEIWKLVEW